MLLSPLSVATATRLRLPVSRASALCFILASPGMLLATAATSLPVFMVGVYLSVPLCAMAIPLVTAMWQQNAPPELRGKSFSRVMFTGGLAAVLSSIAITLLLGDDPGRYRWATSTFAIMLIAAGLALLRVPSRPLEFKKRGDRHHGIAVLLLLWHDRLFGYLCIAQMLIGFANLATIPLRLEFFGSQVRGMGYSPRTVFLLATVLPEVARFAAIPLWGRLFDQMNFALMRMSVSLCFVFSLLTAFSPLLPLQIIGSALFGLAMGGGAIAWSLWVTKLAPAEKTADYMSVHTFLTGFRGIIGPQIAFLLLGGLSFAAIGRLGALMILTSIAMLVPMIRRFDNIKHA